MIPRRTFCYLENVWQTLFSVPDISTTLSTAGQNVRQCLDSLPDISKSCRTCPAYLAINVKDLRHCHTIKDWKGPTNPSFGMTPTIVQLVSYQKKNCQGHARQSFLWYDNANDLKDAFCIFVAHASGVDLIADVILPSGQRAACFQGLFTSSYGKGYLFCLGLGRCRSSDFFLSRTWLGRTHHTIKLQQI